MNRAKKLLSYTNSKHNILAVVFVLVVLLVAQHPNLFSQPINTVWGKLLVLIIVLLLTHYNIVAGLAAVISVIGLHIYLHNSGYEGFENAATEPAKKEDPATPVASTGKTEPATITKDGEVKDATVTNVLAPAPVDKPKVKPVPVAKPPTANMVDKQLNAHEQIVKPTPSSHQMSTEKGTSENAVAHSPPGPGTLKASPIKQE